MTSYPLAERSSPKNRSHTRLFGLLLALALIAAACSQTPEEQAAPPPGEPSTTTTATTTTTTPATTTTLGLSEFAGAEVTVLVQPNPTMDAIQELTPEFFTEPTGIEVTFTNLEDFNNSVQATVLAESIGLTSSHTFVDQDGNPIPESEAAGALVIYQELPHRRLVLPGREIQLTLQVPE